MSNVANKDYMVTAFDEVVTKNGHRIELQKSRRQVAERYAKDVMRGRVGRPEQTLVSEGLALFDRFVKPERDRRRKGRHGFAEQIAKSLLGNSEPVLDLAVPLGDGTDKILRYWSIADWKESVAVRNRAADDAAESAAEHEKYAEIVIEALAEGSTEFTGDLFTSKKRAA